VSTNGSPARDNFGLETDRVSSVEVNHVSTQSSRSETCFKYFSSPTHSQATHVQHTLLHLAQAIFLFLVSAQHAWELLAL
jgi:hypothetical protein